MTNRPDGMMKTMAIPEEGTESTQEVETQEPKRAFKTLAIPEEQPKDSTQETQAPKRAFKTMAIPEEQPKDSTTMEPSKRAMRIDKTLAIPEEEEAGTAVEGADAEPSPLTPFGDK